MYGKFTKISKFNTTVKIRNSKTAYSNILVEIIIWDTWYIHDLSTTYGYISKNIQIYLPLIGAQSVIQAT